MRIYVTLILALGLNACTTPEQRSLQQQARDEQYRQELNSKCAAQGYQEGTPAFSGCVTRVDLANPQRVNAITRY
jgi:hypothetical protein